MSMGGNIGDPCSKHMLDVTVRVCNGDSEDTVRITGIQFTWYHEQMTREVAEYAAALDYVTDHLEFEWFSLLSLSSTGDLS